MNNIVKMLKKDNFDINENIAQKSWDLATEEDTEIFTDYLYDILDKNKINGNVDISDTSYMTDEDEENEENSWIVVDLNIELNEISEENFKKFLKDLNRNSQRKEELDYECGM